MDSSTSNKQMNENCFPHLEDFLKLYSDPANTSRLYTRGQLLVAYRAYLSRIKPDEVVSMDYIKFGKHLQKTAEKLSIKTSVVSKTLFYELKLNSLSSSANEENQNIIKEKETDAMKVKLADLNVHICCKICCGYLVDATTITECLHSFCKSCITKHLAVYMSCPVCNVSLTNSNLLTSVKPDIVLQDIVDKLLPGLQTCERQSFVEFSKEDNSPKPITQFCNYKMITVYLDWVGSELCSIPVKDLECNFIRTSNKATISHFAQFVMDKLARDPRNERCEIMCGGVTLPTIFTLEMLIENNLDFETKRGFVHLQYDILGHT